MDKRRGGRSPIMSNWIDPQAKISVTARLGDFIKVWAFANIMADVYLGDYCSIGGCSEIGRGTIIGDHSRVGYGVFLPDHSQIGSYVFIGPRAVFTDDRYPRVENGDYKAEPPIIEDYASIGAGAVILPGVKIGCHAMIGAGAIVTHNVKPYAVVVGNPAKQISIRREEVYESGN